MSEIAADEAVYFASVSERLHSTTDVGATLANICAQALEVLPARWVGITLRRRRGRFESAASTDEVAMRCDILQSQLQEGPCVEAAEQGEAFLVEDTRKDGRWPNWGPQAAAEGARSVVSLQLVAPGGEEPPRRLGAINGYESATGAFGSADLRRGLVLATHAASALSAADQISGLELALDSRHLIGAAQGILMARYGLTHERATEVLKRRAADTNTKLRDLAEQVLAARELPPLPGRPTG